MNLPIVVLGIIAGFVLIPTSKDPTAPKLDPVGAVLSIVALVSIVYALIEAPDIGWTAPKTLAVFAGGLVAMGVFVWWERRSDHPMLDVGFFKNPRFSAANAAITLTFFAMFGSIFLLTQYLQFTLGYSPLESGIRMLPYAGTMMVVAPLELTGGRTVRVQEHDRAGPRIGRSRRSCSSGASRSTRATRRHCLAVRDPGGGYGSGDGAGH